MITHILTPSWTLKSHWLLSENLLRLFPLVVRIVEIVMLWALFIIGDFLISMLGLWCRAWDTAMRLAVLLLLGSVTVCFLRVPLIWMSQVAIWLMTIVQCSLRLKPGPQMILLLLYLRHLRFCHQYLHHLTVLPQPLNLCNWFPYLSLHLIRALCPYHAYDLQQAHYLSALNLPLTPFSLFLFSHNNLFLKVLGVKVGILLVVLFDLMESVH